MAEKKRRTALDLAPAQVTCEMCGTKVLPGNLGRHKKTFHLQGQEPPRRVCRAAGRPEGSSGESSDAEDLPPLVRPPAARRPSPSQVEEAVAAILESPDYSEEAVTPLLYQHPVFPAEYAAHFVLAVAGAARYVLSRAQMARAFSKSADPQKKIKASEIDCLLALWHAGLQTGSSGTDTRARSTPNVSPAVLSTPVTQSDTRVVQLTLPEKPNAPTDGELGDFFSVAHGTNAGQHSTVQIVGDPTTPAQMYGTTSHVMYSATLQTPPDTSVQGATGEAVYNPFPATSYDLFATAFESFPGNSTGAQIDLTYVASCSTEAITTRQPVFEQFGSPMAFTSDATDPYVSQTTITHDATEQVQDKGSSCVAAKPVLLISQTGNEIDFDMSPQELPSGSVTNQPAALEGASTQYPTEMEVAALARQPPAKKEGKLKEDQKRTTEEDKKREDRGKQLVKKTGEKKKLSPREEKAQTTKKRREQEQGDREASDARAIRDKGEKESCAREEEEARRKHKEEKAKKYAELKETKRRQEELQAELERQIEKLRQKETEYRRMRDGEQEPKATGDAGRKNEKGGDRAHNDAAKTTERRHH